MSAIPHTIAALQTLPAVVGFVQTRIHPIQAPQGAALPHIVVNVGSEAENMTLGGATSRPEARAVIIIRASSAKETGDIGAAVIAGLKAKYGAGSAPAEFYRDDVDSSDYLEGPRIYRRILGFTVIYNN
jgi:hypothetical protein